MGEFTQDMRVSFSRVTEAIFPQKRVCENLSVNRKTFWREGDADIILDTQ